MVIVGVWHVLVDSTALANDKIYVSAPNTIYSYDLTGWCWIHLLAVLLGGSRRGSARPDVGRGSGSCWRR